MPARLAGAEITDPVVIAAKVTPACEVLIRVTLRRMFPSSLVSAFDLGHDHITDIAIEPVAALTP